MKKYFTLDDANRQLPLIDPLLRELRDLQKEINDRHHQLRHAKAALGKIASPDSFFAEEAGLEFMVLQANQLIAKVQDLGAEIKNIEIGLIDFYTLIDGHEAYLCWRLGEPEIQFWHGLNEGFVGRKPVSLLDWEEN